MTKKSTLLPEDPVIRDKALRAANHEIEPKLARIQRGYPPSLTDTGDSNIVRPDFFKILDGRTTHAKYT